ncbi:MAG: hypothetical protein ACI4TM_04935 [Candidatus Cryptobacteroides sp.]
MDNKIKNYQAPQAFSVDLSVEGCLCASAETQWYKNGPTGNFTYGIEDDETWK